MYIYWVFYIYYVLGSYFEEGGSGGFFVGVGVKKFIGEVVFGDSVFI